MIIRIFTAVFKFSLTIPHYSSEDVTDIISLLNPLILNHYGHGRIKAEFNNAKFLSRRKTCEDNLISFDIKYDN